MKNKILSSLAAVFWVATLVLVIYWVVSISPTDFPVKGSPSGWWWFTCLLLATFLSNLDD